MARVELRNEIVFKAPTRVGLLADVTRAVFETGTNILAIGAYDKGDMGEFLMITDDNGAAMSALEGMGTVELQGVIVAEVDNEPGTLGRMAERLADAGVNVSQIHATTTDAPTAMVVIKAQGDIDVAMLLAGV